MIEFTDQALKEAERLATDALNQGKSLRIYIEGKGCDGFYYGVAFDDKHPEDTVVPQEKLSDGPEVVIDQESLKYMQGSIVEYVDDERGKGFLVNNPSHKKFRGKFYRAKNWTQRLST